tara:strand:- start:48 stop:302 length:255 start_codon:yes stop_codon:yes gene_type:complete
MKLHPVKTPTSIVAILAACVFLPTPISASDAIRPYVKSGESGQFSYAIYNNQWLLHGQKAIDEKHLTRVTDWLAEKGSGIPYAC